MCVLPNVAALDRLCLSGHSSCLDACVTKEKAYFEHPHFAQNVANMTGGSPYYPCFRVDIRAFTGAEESSVDHLTSLLYKMVCNMSVAVTMQII